MIAEREIRAFYTKDFIRVYQAYNNDIANLAILNQKFVPPFKPGRTTWIKPSFCWMMYRSGWATKENQERILAIDISHQGFNWALVNSKSSYQPTNHPEKKEAHVVIQWDPERNILLNKLAYRTIQIGLKPLAAALYNSEWIKEITDITILSKKIKSLIDNDMFHVANQLLPEERPYQPTGFHF